MNHLAVEDLYRPKSAAESYRSNRSSLSRSNFDEKPSFGLPKASSFEDTESSSNDLFDLKTGRKARSVSTPNHKNPSCLAVELIYSYPYLSHRHKLGVDIVEIAARLAPLGVHMVRYYYALANESEMWYRAFKACRGQANVSLWPHDVFSMDLDGNIDVSHSLDHSVRIRLQRSRAIVKNESHDMGTSSQADGDHKKLNSMKIDRVRKAMVAYFTRCNLWRKQEKDRNEALHFMRAHSVPAISDDRMPVKIPRLQLAPTDYRDYEQDSLFGTTRLLNSTYRQSARPSTTSPTTPLKTVRLQSRMPSSKKSDSSFSSGSSTSSSFESSATTDDVLEQSCIEDSFAMETFGARFCSKQSEAKIKTLFTWLLAESKALKLIEAALRNTQSTKSKNEARDGSLAIINHAKSICPGLRPDMPAIRMLLTASGYSQYKNDRAAVGPKLPTSLVGNHQESSDLADEGGHDIIESRTQHVGYIVRRFENGVSASHFQVHAPINSRLSISSERNSEATLDTDILIWKASSVSKSSSEKLTPIVPRLKLSEQKEYISY